MVAFEELYGARATFPYFNSFRIDGAGNNSRLGDIGRLPRIIAPAARDRAVLRVFP